MTPSLWGLKEKMTDCANESGIPEARMGRVTGVLVSYYCVCHTKLWLFSHKIEMEQESDDVLIGRVLDQVRYGRSQKGVKISENAVVDFAVRGQTLEIHDIKKSSKLEHAHILQMAFYLWTMKEKGLNARGFINYPQEHRRTVVILDDYLERRLLAAFRDIEEIRSRSMPLPIRKPYCSRCAYSSFCWADADEV